MAVNDIQYPQEGEYVVVTVSSIEKNGAYLNLNGFSDDIRAFVFVGEVSSGWVARVRDHIREGQRTVARVTKVRKDKRSVDVSIKSVSEERRRETLQDWKNEQRAAQLLKIVGDRNNWKDSELVKMSNELEETFGTLYGSFEEVAANADILGEMGLEGDWTSHFIELALENIVPSSVIIRGRMMIEVWDDEGVELIKKSLIGAESASSKKDEVSVSCYYDGAPEYRVEVVAPDYKLAEKAWVSAQKTVEDLVKSAGGSVECYRD